ncbi:MAG TPA: sulfatase, partial [Phycisphaerae bacterium]|nr:sulfatase [Phycisphaerae bacterium]
MSKPNIILIYSDQHRYDCLGVNGHPLLQTPNLDRLAGGGANFSHAFTPIPICIPARCSLLTSQWPQQHGVVANFDAETFRPIDKDVPTFPRVLRDGGYHTIHVGRWHVDRKLSPLDFGFQEYVADWRYGKWRNGKHLPPVPRDAGWRGQVDPHIDPSQSSLAFQADQVVRQIDYSREVAERFFIRWHTIEPHLPCRPCEPYASMYDPADIEPWAGFDDDFHDKPYAQKQLRVNWDVQDMTWDDWAPFVARYLGVITQLDDQVGRVMKALDERGLADDTLVVYTSDHGDLCGSHGLPDKHFVMYDDVVRVPMMMRWPGRIAPAQQLDQFISNAIDLGPTFCGAAALE